MLLASTVRVSAWLLQTAVTRPDTVVTRQIIERGGFDQLAHVAGGILVLLLLVVVLLVFPAAWYMRERLNQLTAGIDGIRHDFAPLIESGRSVMQSAEDISATVRRDVTRISETVNRLDGQLREIGDIAGDRVRGFDALLGTAQDEAEDVLLTSASAARGVRAGMRLFERFRNRHKGSDAEQNDGGSDDADAPGAEDDGAVPSRRPPVSRQRRRRHAT